MTPRVVVLGDLMCDVVAVHDGPLAHGSDTPAEISLRPGGGRAPTSPPGWPRRRGGRAVGRVGRRRRGGGRAGPAGRRRALRDARRGRSTGMCVVLVAAGRRAHDAPRPRAPTTPSRPDVPDDCSWPAACCTCPATCCCGPARARRRSTRWRAPAPRGCRPVDPASAAPLAADPAFLDRARPVDLLLPNALEAEALGELAGARVGRDARRGRRPRGATAAHRAAPAVTSTTWSTPPGRATRSPPASSARWPGPAEEALATGVGSPPGRWARLGAPPPD